MALRSGLFDSTAVVETAEGFPRGNRAESADFFARYFSRFVGNGVCADPADGFAVRAAGGLNISVLPGDAFINGYFAFSDETQTLTLTSSAQEKTVRAVLRLDTSAGEITLALLDGDTELTRSGNIYELALADITVGAEASAVYQSGIRDLRLSEELCGQVMGITWTPDTSAYAAQLGALADDAAEAVAGLEDCLRDSSEEFDGWFDSVRARLSDSDAASLTENKAEKDLSNVPAGSVSYSHLSAEVKRKMESSAPWYDFYTVRTV